MLLYSLCKFTQQIRAEPVHYYHSQLFCQTPRFGFSCLSDNSSEAEDGTSMSEIVISSLSRLNAHVK